MLFLACIGRLRKQGRYSMGGWGVVPSTPPPGRETLVSHVKKREQMIF